MYYKDIEFLRQDEINEIQRELFKKQLSYLGERSLYYCNLFKKLHININKVSIEDLTELPFTEKSTFEKYNDQFIAVPHHKICDIVLSSGTTGKQTRVFYTDSDLLRLAYNEEISFKRIGITPDDTVLLTCTMDRCFIAGLAYFLGTRNIGAAAIRSGINTFESHLEIIQTMSPSTIVGVPSLLRRLGLFMKTSGTNPQSTSVSKLMCIGEPIRERSLSLLKLGEELETLWGAKVFSTYASSEVVTTFCECTYQRGGHYHPALAVVEIINEKGQRLPYGEIGEVVVTPLYIEGMPLLRFKTGDMSFLINEPCQCGRFFSRLGPILGRKNQMIKLRGTTLFPQAIYAVIDGIPEINEYYIVVISDFDLSDNITIYLSMKNSIYSVEKIINRLQSLLRVKPEVVILKNEDVKKKVYSENARKAVRFFDKREHN